MTIELGRFIRRFERKISRGFLRELSRRLVAVIVLAVICSGFLPNCEVAKAATFNPADYADYVIMSESDAIKAYNNYIETMTPGGEELKICCMSGVNEELKYKSYSVCFDSYMKFAYQAASEIMLVHSSVEGYKTYYRYYCTIRELHSSMTASEYSQAINKAKQVADDNDYGSDYDKIKRVYKWICDNVEYDYSYEDGSIYDALIGGKSVCSGYAGTFQVIMDALGIECYINEGKANGEDHAWNIVKLDGKYYFVDATWGDTSTEYDKYLLFGTDLRTNITELELASSSYGSAQLPSETTASGGAQETQAATKPAEKETIAAKPTEAPASGSESIENVEIAENNNETSGQTAGENKEQQGAGQENNQENDTQQGNSTADNSTENAGENSSGESAKNSSENQVDKQTDSQSERMTSVSEESGESSGKDNRLLIMILSAAGILFVAGTTFVYIKFIKR